ncbi:MAG: ACT domain-containing protein [Oscillospiraceae bacterium]|nr:ACT domain-containing protein [Oscillospiraceae bacterium]
MTVKQLSIFVENKSGRMAEITERIAEAGINIRALSIADTTNFGILRLIVDNPDRAEAALKDKGMTVSLTDVIAVQIVDEPGSFAKAVRLLAEKGIDIEYMYAFICRQHGKACVIIRVEDNAAAMRVLEAGNIGMLTQDEIYSM